MTTGLIFDTDRLRGRMTEKGFNIKRLAKVIGIHENTLSNKLYSLSYFNTAEVLAICDALDIDKAEIQAYFFIHK